MERGHQYPVVALVNGRGGGDAPPALAFAAALRDRGHGVRLLCDGGAAEGVRPAAGLGQWISPRSRRRT
jgi:UDP:flavonoid glycosyltransferase YjiC (YdhE family)